MAQTWNLKSVCVGLVLGVSGALAVGARQAASPQFTDYVVVKSMSQSGFEREVPS